MKPVHKKSVVERILDLKKEVDMSNHFLDYISLTDEEGLELHDFLVNFYEGGLNKLQTPKGKLNRIHDMQLYGIKIKVESLI